MKNILAAILLLAFSVGEAHALNSTDQLVKDCTVVLTKPEEAFRNVQCKGYVGGVLDAYGVLSGMREASHKE